MGFPTIAKGQSSEIAEGAKKEGRLLLYTSLTLQEFDEVAGPFTKKYPFLKLESFRGNALQLLQKISTEARAGRPQVDVAQFNGFEAWQLQNLGLLQSYKSPEARNFPEGYKDPEGFWTTLYTNYLVLGYNPKIVAAADVPKNGMIFYILDGKATSSRSTEIMPSGMGACHFIWARKKRPSSCEPWPTSSRACGRDIL